MGIITSIQIPDKDSAKQYSYRPISCELGHRYPQQNVSRFNLIMYKNNYKTSLIMVIPGMQGWFNIWKSVNKIHCYQQAKEEKLH